MELSGFEQTALFVQLQCIVLLGSPAVSTLFQKAAISETLLAYISFNNPDWQR